MKILHITPSYKPAYIYGGPIESVGKLCEGLADAGHNVDVYTTTANGKTELDVNPGNVYDISGVQVIYFKRITKDHTHISTALWRHLFKNVNKYDIVHIHSWWNILVIVAAIICVAKGKKTIIAPRGMLSNYIFTTGSSKSKKLIDRFGGRYTLSKSYFHATSQSEYEECKKLIKGWQGFVLPNILTLPEIPIAKKENEVFTIIFLSRIHPKKGLEILLTALSKVNFKCILKIAGSGEDAYIKELKDLISELNINNNVEWIGWKDRDTKFVELMTSDLFALVSHNENFANVVIESLYVGTPVLISNKVGLFDFIKEQDLGWVCDISVESTVISLNEAYRNATKRKHINTKGRDTINEFFSKEILINKYTDAYIDIIKN
jgi:glycosyltransferase involved in cell wall biosynthesis